jgi:two-component system sensor histidine kinase KdpD
MQTTGNHSPKLIHWAIVAVLLIAATGGGFAVDHHVSLTSQAMLYVLVVVIASYKLPFLPSLVCAVAAVTAFNFFFVPPRWTFQVDSQEHLIGLAVMLLVSLAVSHLAAGLRRETETAQLNAMRATQLQALATKLATLTTAEEVCTTGSHAVGLAFNGPNILARLQQDGTLVTPANADSNIIEGLNSCMHEAATLGPGTGRWPGLNAWYIPLGNQAQMGGAVCIQNVSAADNAGREHAQALCALIGQALWRLKLSEDMRTSQAEIQRQQVQGTFLAAISHDLRTPLAAVVGAASALQTQRDKLSAEEQDRLLGSIVSEASYLSTITENTLQLVQLTNAAQPLHRDWESMEEIVGSVLARMRQRDPQRRIHAKVPEGLPLIQADPVLLAQMLNNLLDNALKYSEGVIDLSVSVRPDAMEIAVKDRAQSIPDELQQSVFEPYARNDRSGKRGAGLGLALCRAIATAHGGSLTLHRRSGGGNRFTFCMPLSPAQPTGGTP